MNFVIAYGLSFIAIGSTVTHGIIYLRKPTLMHFRRSLQEQPDVHARLMTKYAQGTSESFVSLRVLLIEMDSSGLVLRLRVRCDIVLPISLRKNLIS